MRAQASGDPSSFFQSHPGVLQHQMRTELMRPQQPRPPSPMGMYGGPQQPQMGSDAMQQGPQGPNMFGGGQFGGNFGAQNPQMGSDFMQQPMGQGYSKSGFGGQMGQMGGPMGSSLSSLGVNPGMQQVLQNRLGGGMPAPQGAGQQRRADAGQQYTNFPGGNY
jgi:hypothetical protein